MAKYVDGFVLPVPKRKLAAYRRLVKLKRGEVVVFSYILYKSRQQRDRVNAKAMKDTRLAKMMDRKAMPFDGKRVFWGGFKSIVSY